MTSFLAETGTLADAVSKAARVAPSKGVAAEKCSGVELVYSDKFEDQQLTVKSLDLDSTYLQRVSTLESHGDSANWRVPAPLLAGFLSNLPLSAGKVVDVSEADGFLHLACGTAVAKLRLMADPLPAVTTYDEDGFVEVSDLARKMSQVSWAAARDVKRGPICGVYINGTHLIATDTYRLAMIPCDLPVTTPIAVPLFRLSSLLRDVGSIRMKVAGDKLLLMPDEDTQISCAIFQAPYPRVEQIISKFPEADRAFVVSREALADSLERMLVLFKQETDPPKMTVTFGAMTLGLKVSSMMVGEITDQVECDATITGEDPFDVRFNPNHLLDAVKHASRETIEIRTDGNPQHIAVITDASGYRVFQMPVVGT